MGPLSLWDEALVAVVPAAYGLRMSDDAAVGLARLARLPRRVLARRELRTVRPDHLRVSPRRKASTNTPRPAAEQRVRPHSRTDRRRTLLDHARRRHGPCAFADSRSAQARHPRPHRACPTPHIDALKASLLASARRHGGHRASPEGAVRAAYERH